MKAKELRNKLIAAALMLTVSATMLGGTSYAWFTLSTNPEVKGITANISANENLEIALDNSYADGAAVDTASKDDTIPNKVGNTGNPYTWGNLVDLSYAFTTDNFGTKLALKPVKYSASGATVGFQYPQYGADGRVATLASLTAASKTDKSDVTVTGTAVTSVTGFTQDNGTTYDALSVTYWLRSNMPNVQVDLSATGVNRAKSSEDTGTAAAAATDVNLIAGAGSYIDFTSSADADLVWNLLSTNLLKIRLDQTGATSLTSYFAVPVEASKQTSNKYTLKLVTADANGAPTTTAGKINLGDANTANKIVLSVYLDGETMANKDALLADLTGVTLNIQFNGKNASGAIVVDDAMNVGNATTTTP